MLTNAAHALTGWAPAWCRDLCVYYHIRPSEALELGTRAPGRRPSLPGSKTCPPVLGKTWEELWENRPRDTEEARFAFWQEVGSWCAFRQALRNRRRSFRFVLERLGMGDRFLEYGAGIAPASWWLLQHCPVPLHLTIADVPSEHLNFGTWRLWRCLQFDRDPCCWTLRAIALEPSILPLKDTYHAITAIEVLEHVSHPLQTVAHLVEHLSPRGWLFEDFVPHAAAHAADLPSAQQERPAVYAYLEKTCELLAGRHWALPGGGGTRTWRKC